MPVQLETPAGAAVEPTEGQTEVTPEGGSTEVQDQGSQTEQAFYDAKLVPEGLRESYKAMQAAWTKKTQEASASLKPYADFESKYGKLAEVGAFVDQLRDPQGVLNWWVGVAQQLGVPQERLTALFNQGEQQAQGQQQPGQAPHELDRPMTVREYQAMQAQAQQEWQAQEQARRDDAEVVSIMEQLKVPNDARQIVASLARLHPQELGYAERLKRGLADYQKHVDGVVAAKSGAAAAANSGAPRGLGGNMPGQGGMKAAPKTFGDAMSAAQAFLDGLGG